MRYANQGISDQILHELQPFGALVLWVNCGVDFVMKGGSHSPPHSSCIPSAKHRVRLCEM